MEPFLGKKTPSTPDLTLLRGYKGMLNHLRFSQQRIRMKRVNPAGKDINSFTFCKVNILQRCSFNFFFNYNK